MFPIRSLVCFCALACASPALAADAGVYIGAGVGQARYGIDLGQQVAQAYATSPFAVSSARLDGAHDTAYRVFAGYAFSPHFAVEAGWQDLGSVNGGYSLRNTSTDETFGRNDTWDLSGVDALFVAQYPFAERFAILGKVGAFYSKLDFQEIATDSDGSQSTYHAKADKDVHLMWGLGGSWRFNERLAARLDWDRIEDVGTKFALDDDGNGRFDHVDVWRVSLIWQFL